MSAATQLEVRFAGKEDDELEARANMARARLLDAIDVLDHRRHAALDVGDRVQDVRRRVREHGPAVVAASVGVALAGIAFVGYRLATRGRRRLRARDAMLDRMLAHPDRVARKHDPGPSVLVRIAKTVLLALVTRAVRNRL